MTTPTEFDKELHGIVVKAILSFATSEETELFLTHLQTDEDYHDAIEGIKQAVDKHVIGKDVNSVLKSAVEIGRELQAKQRQSLWGEK